MDVPRRFRLQRTVDATGVSGTGTVADGVLWPDGSAALRWRTQHASTAVYASLADVEHIHGHGGATQVVWLDDAGRLDLDVVRARTGRVLATRVVGPDGNEYVAALEASQADVHALAAEIDLLRGVTP